MVGRLTTVAEFFALYTIVTAEHFNYLQRFLRLPYLIAFGTHEFVLGIFLCVLIFGDRPLCSGRQQ